MGLNFPQKGFEWWVGTGEPEFRRHFHCYPKKRIKKIYILGLETHSEGKPFALPKSFSSLRVLAGPYQRSPPPSPWLQDKASLQQDKPWPQSPPKKTHRALARKPNSAILNIQIKKHHLVLQDQAQTLVGPAGIWTP